MSFELHRGDCLAVLRGMADNSVDSIVTDPPYGLSEQKPAELAACIAAWAAGEVYQPKGKGFMGKAWDSWVPGPEVWRECFRVLKPGGHLLAFAGTRTQHLMALSVALAGFEIRDLIAWVYGSGFPKSLNVAKAIESGGGRPDDIRRMQMGEGYEPSGRGRNNYDHGAGSAMGAGAAEWQPATDAARQWQGWGTALKPALEPITVARKPLAGTVAENVLAHGTGALNIDGCRVAGEVPRTVQGQSARAGEVYGADQRDQRVFEPHDAGRWPANLIHDGSGEVLAAFPDSNGSGPARKLKRGQRADGDGWGMADAEGDLRDAGSGSAARFFYCAKASRADRNEGMASSDTPAVATKATMREREDADWPARNGNHHPTVKPTDLMRYLCRLVTPPGGTVLDCYMGSGSTGKAAVLEGFNFIGIERDEDENGQPVGYLDIARARIEHAARQVAAPKAKTKAKPKATKPEPPPPPPPKPGEVGYIGDLFR